MVWRDQTSRTTSLGPNRIQSKVPTRFNSVKAERDEEAAQDGCEVSRAMFTNLKERSHLQNIKSPRQAASTDVDTAASCLEELAKIINKGGHTKQQIFNVDSTALLWKMPSRPFIGRVQVSTWLQKTG